MHHQDYQTPSTLGTPHQVWYIEASIEFAAQGLDKNNSLDTHLTTNTNTLINDTASSPGYAISYRNNL
ncbi:UUP1 family membrane protein, partial [Vibrio cholerae]|uniref:UUP1 family membrane protein n=1 Tax=Vibrio cholerae TaxID=666 RepID=UPI001396B625